MILTDSSGKVIVDTANQLAGKSISSLDIGSGISLQLSGQPIGTLYLATPMGMGKGYMGGRGMAGSADSSGSTINQAAEGVLSQINSYIWIAGLIAIAIALLLGIFLTRQITRPLRALNTGAKHISQGDLGFRVKVQSGDKLGELAKSFNEMAIQLDNSEQSRQRLVSDVAHELRTPLTIIQGTVDGIQDGVFPPDEEHLDSIKEQTKLLTHLVNDLRDLSLAESGKLKLDLQSTDIVNLIQRKLTQFEVNVRQKNIRFDLMALSNIPEIKIDSRRIEQVVSNMIQADIFTTSYFSVYGLYVQIGTNIFPNKLR